MGGDVTFVGRRDFAGDSSGNTHPKCRNCQLATGRGRVRAMNPPTLLDPALLGLLRCPETRQTLARAPDGVLVALDGERAAGRLVNRAGKLVTEPVTEGLLRADGMVFYPMSAGIPLLTSDDAVIVPPT